MVGNHSSGYGFMSVLNFMRMQITVVGSTLLDLKSLRSSSCFGRWKEPVITTVSRKCANPFLDVVWTQVSSFDLVPWQDLVVVWLWSNLSVT